MATTFSESLKSSAVDFGTLHKKYHPMLALVKELIGVIPNCDPTLEIWPPGFRTYNLLVPNMLNLPQTIFGAKSLKAAMGLAMYTVSKAAQCPYCTAHTCSFALRRGLNPEAIDGKLTDAQKAVVALATGMGQIPVTLTKAACDAMTEHFSREQIDSIVFAICLMGFLNKVMNGLGVELEPEAMNDVGELLEKTGWSPGSVFCGKADPAKSALPPTDNFFTYLRIIRQAPGAVRIEKEWTRGVPDNYTAANEYLKIHTGSTFSILTHISRKRVIVTLTTALRDNLDKNNTVAGLVSKYLGAYVFACVVSNAHLQTEVLAMSKQMAPQLESAIYSKLEQLALTEIPDDIEAVNRLMSELVSLNLSRKDSALIIIARAASGSPTMINDAVIKMSLIELTPASIVEIMIWLSLQQLLHRLGSYYRIAQ